LDSSTQAASSSRGPVLDPAPGPRGVAEGTAPAPRRGLFRFSLVVVGFTLLHIKLGAMVTSTGSGLAFEDWPLSNGSLWPPDMGLDGLFEHGHRTSGTIVGMLVLALTIWVCLRDPRSWLRKLALGALALVVLIGILGGKGVEWGLPPATSIAHGVLAQVILCVLALISFALSNAWNTRIIVPDAQVRTARRLTAAGLVLVFCQLFAGATLRHTNAQGMLWLHVFMAMVVALVILLGAMYCGTRFGKRAGFARLGRVVLVLLLVQILLGFTTLAVRRVKDPSNIEYLGRSLVASVHVVVGALLFLSAALLTYRAMRNLQSEAAVGSADVA
jgi:cytochrome c oxidase assembly protein subunit 15